MAGWKVAQGGIAAAIGTDIMAGNRDQVIPYPRKLLAVGYIGSDAVGTGELDIYIGPVFVCHLAVTTVAAALNKQVDVLPVDIIVPANTMIHAYVTEAGATNVTNLWMMFS